MLVEEKRRDYIYTIPPLHCMWIFFKEKYLAESNSILFALVLHQYE